MLLSKELFHLLSAFRTLKAKTLGKTLP